MIAARLRAASRTTKKVDKAVGYKIAVLVRFFTRSVENNRSACRFGERENSAVGGTAEC